LPGSGRIPTTVLIVIALTLLVLFPATGCPGTQEKTTGEEATGEEATDTTDPLDNVPPVDPEEATAVERVATDFLTALFSGDAETAINNLCTATREAEELNQQNLSERFPTDGVELGEVNPWATGITGELAAVFFRTPNSSLGGEEGGSFQSVTILLYHDEGNWKVLAFTTSSNELREMDDIRVGKIGEGSYKIQFHHYDPQTGPGSGAMRFSAADVPVD